MLDQTAGAAFNTALFSSYMHGVRAATAAGGGGVARVDWAGVWARTRAEFWPIVRAGWSFWPFVSVVNFVFLTSVEARNLLGSLAGLGWGVYVSMLTAK